MDKNQELNSFLHWLPQYNGGKVCVKFRDTECSGGNFPTKMNPLEIESMKYLDKSGNWLEVNQTLPKSIFDTWGKIGEFFLHL